MKGVSRLVLLRHGESAWNRSNRFTGWTDVELTPYGRAQAVQAGRCLGAAGFEFDRCHTSALKRAIVTAHLVLEEMDRLWLPVEKNWRLNERHYGALQGLNKDAAAARFGTEQVAAWRRGYAARPPAQDSASPGPASESLADTADRVLSHWHKTLLPEIVHGDRLLVVAHGNSLRALIKHIEGIDDKAIEQLEVPIGEPLLVEFDASLRPVVPHRRLGHDAASNATDQAGTASTSNRRQAFP
jgi:2,3-bisphosphoglycerate-dependent phosphoglycerate mutase